MAGGPTEDGSSSGTSTTWLADGYTLRLAARCPALRVVEPSGVVALRRRARSGRIRASLRARPTPCAPKGRPAMAHRWRDSVARTACTSPHRPRPRRRSDRHNVLSGRSGLTKRLLPPVPGRTSRLGRASLGLSQGFCHRAVLDIAVLLAEDPDREHDAPRPRLRKVVFFDALH
jgi:hypothetical protein